MVGRRDVFLYLALVMLVNFFQVQYVNHNEEQTTHEYLSVHTSGVSTVPLWSSLPPTLACIAINPCTVYIQLAATARE